MRPLGRQDRHTDTHTHTPAPTKGSASCWMESGLCNPNSCVALGHSLSPSEFWFLDPNRSLEDTCLAGRV